MATSITFTQTGVTHTWQSATFRLNGDHIDGKSNVYFTLKVGGVTTFSQEAPPKNDIDGNKTYTFNFLNFSTAREEDERWYVRAVFDTNLETDYSCTATLNW